MTSGTVDNFMVLLVSKLTQYDMAEMKREMKRGGRGNIYRLGHLLEAADKVRQRVQKRLHESDPKAMEAFRHALQMQFTMDPPIAPIRNVLKQIDAWETKGQAPNIVRR